MIEHDPEPEFHEPSDEAFACLRLELHRPTLEGSEKSKEAWNELRSARRSIGQAVQRAIGDVVVHVRNLRAAGKTRFAVPAEKTNAKLGIPLPVECYADDDLKPIAGFVSDALRASGLSEYVYSSVARRIQLSELAGDKIRDLLRGEAAYPVLRRVGIMMRARNWQITSESRVANGKEYVDIVVEIAALRPGLGKMRLVCKSLHGPKLAHSKKLIKALEALGTATTSTNGWSKGALTIHPLRRPGQPEKWMLLLPYASPRSTASSSGTVVAVHRGVANMLTAAVAHQGNVTTYQYPGRDIVLLKHQMYARRKFVARDLAAKPHRKRGKRRHYAALARLSDKERRATETHLWSAARWVQNIAEAAGAKLLLLDDFTSFDPDLPGPPLQPYVRRFPLAELKLKVIDALTRRAGIPVQEVPSQYISQHCPECGNVDKSNVARLPKTMGVDVEKGWFKCLKCGFETELDSVSVRNLLNAYEKTPPAVEVATK